MTGDQNISVDSDGNHVHKRGSDISVEKEGEQPAHILS